MYKKLNKFNDEIISLKNVASRKEEKKELKYQVLSNAKKLYNELYYIYNKKYNKEINSLDTENRTKLDYKKLRLSDYQYLSEEEQEEQKPTKDDYKTLIKQIIDEETDINDDLFNKYFKFQRPSDMLMLLNKTNDTEKNNKLVNLINSGLKDLKEEIKKMSEKEKEIEDPESIVEIVEEILKFNKQKQEGQGIKILTPNQMLSRLPISLAQLQAGNSSEKLKNEIRQLFYSLYHSKNMAKQVYNNLIKPI